MEFRSLVIGKETIQVIAYKHIGVAEAELGTYTVPEIVEVVIVMMMFSLLVVVGIEHLLGVAVHEVSHIRSHAKTESVGAAFAQPVVGTFLTAKRYHGDQGCIDIHRRQFALAIAGVPGVFAEDHAIPIFSEGNFFIAELEIVPTYTSAPVEGEVIGNPGMKSRVDPYIPGSPRPHGI